MKHVEYEMSLTVYLLTLVVVVASLLWAAPAASETTVYEWTSQSGSICWTNMVDRVPDAYKRESLVIRVVDGLESYPKYTSATPRVGR